MQLDYSRTMGSHYLYTANKKSLWTLCNNWFQDPETNYFSDEMFSPGFTEREQKSFLWMLNNIPEERAHDFLCFLEAGGATNKFRAIQLPKRKEVNWNKRNLYRIKNYFSYYNGDEIISVVDEIDIYFDCQFKILRTIVNHVDMFTMEVKKEVKMHPYG